MKNAAFFTYKEAFMNQNQNALIGGIFVAFGFYLLGLKLGLIAPFDAILLLAVAFLGGYLYRRNLKDPSANVLLLIGNIFAALFLSRHIGPWARNIPELRHFAQLETSFYLGLAFLLTWLVENTTKFYHQRRHNFYLFVGAILTFMGGYDLLLGAFNISPAVVRTFLMPAILILVGIWMLASNRSKKIF